MEETLLQKNREDTAKECCIAKVWPSDKKTWFCDCHVEIKRDVIFKGEIYAWRHYDVNGNLHSKFTLDHIYNNKFPTTWKKINGKNYFEWYFHGILLAVKTPKRCERWDLNGKHHSEFDISKVNEKSNNYSSKICTNRGKVKRTITIWRRHGSVLHYYDKELRDGYLDSLEWEYRDDNGQLHHDKKPAKYYWDGWTTQQIYYKHGLRHRRDGPAVITGNAHWKDRQDWEFYLNGRKCFPFEFTLRTGRPPTCRVLRYFNMLNGNFA